MKTTSLILGIILATATAFAANGKGEETSFAIDTKVSKIYWNAKKVTGEHSGYISVGEGTVTVENNTVTGVNVNMDMNSIVCTDITDAGYNQKLVGHLKSDDFFSVEKFPNAKFEISTLKRTANGEYNVNGKLTIKGITNEISFPAKIIVNEEILTAKGTAKVDRTKYDIRYGSGKFFAGLGDKMIYDEFEINFEITAKISDKELSLK